MPPSSSFKLLQSSAHGSPVRGCEPALLASARGHGGAAAVLLPRPRCCAESARATHGDEMLHSLDLLLEPRSRRRRRVQELLDAIALQCKWQQQGGGRGGRTVFRAGKARVPAGHRHRAVSPKRARAPTGAATADSACPGCALTLTVSSKSLPSPPSPSAAILPGCDPRVWVQVGARDVGRSSTASLRRQSSPTR